MIPKLIVFDLDFTLWDCGGTWCDCLSPPFSRQADRIVDRTGRHVRLYDDVAAILDKCDRAHIPMALASRTEQPVWARELVELLQIADRFSYAEIYPSSKLKHFSALADQSELKFEDMLFFDDEQRNIHEVSSLGVTSVFVENGMSSAVFDKGWKSFAANHPRREKVCRGDDDRLS